jgi:hypothetical protein
MFSRDPEGSAFTSENTMFRIATLTLVLLPATAAAQFYPTIAPPNPLYQHPAYRYQFSIGPSVPTVFGRTFVGMTAPATRAPQLFSPNLYSGPTSRYPTPAWRASGSAAAPGYISGGSGGNAAFLAAQKELEREQREAAAARIRSNPQAARDLIYDQWAYEKLGVMGLPSLKGGKEQPEQLVKALGATDEAEVASGEALNHILVAVVAAENKGAKGPSAFLPPQLLDEIRFAGPPTADALNLIRQANNLPLPDAFFDPRLKDARDMLERVFASDG